MSGQPSDWEDVEDDWEDVSPSKTNFSNVKSGSSSSTNGFRQSVLSHPTTIDDYAPESEPDTYTGGFMKGLNDYATELGQGMFKSAAQPESLGDFAGLMLPTSIGRGIGATKGLMSPR